jgi:transglutaminase-like putative cysteine protease
MELDRRNLLRAGAAVSALSLLPGGALADALFAPRPGAWRKFEIVTRMNIQKPSGVTQAWIPVPSADETEWLRSEPSVWATNAAKAVLASEPKYGADMVHAVWNEGEPSPSIEVVSRVTARDRNIDFSKPRSVTPLSPQERALYTEGTTLIPVDGLVKSTSDIIVAGRHSDLEKARAIYEWVVDNTFRDPKVRGCGIGDISTMLETRNLSGKCADLNALYVGLARAAGLPARDVYGIRVGRSNFGYKSLGAKSEVITGAQHCRAEVHLSDFGWVPVDPADVRKVVLEEPPGNLSLQDAKVKAVRGALFGAWEGNWLAYNTAHDVALPGSGGPVLGFLMYPEAETGGFRCDCLAPDTFAYTITAREMNT